MRNWAEMIELKEDKVIITNEKGEKRTKKGFSKWKSELKKIDKIEELMDLYKFLSGLLEHDINKFTKKPNTAASKRIRNYAQKIKDVMLELRVIVLKERQ